MNAERKRVRQPPESIVQAYFLVAHVSLLVALVVVIWQPGLLTEFFYQSRTIAVVHLVTLGWITGSILGALYALGPLAWRTEMPARRLDWIAFWAWAIGVAGMVAHFWLDTYSGMTWSAATTLAAILAVGWRLVPLIARARIPAEHRLPVLLTIGNISLAGTWGIALGLQKVGVVVIPGPPLGALYAHVHLAALGWVLMMIFGAGYRLLPMFLPAAMPMGWAARLPVVTLQAGVLILAMGLTLGYERVTVVGAFLVAAAVVLFLRLVIGMLRNRLDLPFDMPRPDLALPPTVLGIAYLALSMVTGITLLLLDDEVMALRLAALYGVFGILGFLAQFVVGIAGRLLPLTFWMQEFVHGGYKFLAVPLHQLPDRRLQLTVVCGWGLGVPIVAAGVWFARPDVVRMGTMVLLVGALADGANRIVVQRRARAGVPRQTADPDC